MIGIIYVITPHAVRYDWNFSASFGHPSCNASVIAPPDPCSLSPQHSLPSSTGECGGSNCTTEIGFNSTHREHETPIGTMTYKLARLDRKWALPLTHHGCADLRRRRDMQLAYRFVEFSAAHHEAHRSSLRHAMCRFLTSTGIHHMLRRSSSLNSMG